MTPLYIGNLIALFLIPLFITWIYFLPGQIALRRKHYKTPTIMSVNIIAAILLITWIWLAKLPVLFVISLVLWTYCLIRSLLKPKPMTA